MSAAKLNLPSIEKGATFRHTLIWKDSTGVAIDLTGCTAKLQVREAFTANAVLLELNTTNSGLVITPSIGKIELYISSVNTSKLVGIGGIYDLEVYFGNGDTVRLIEGKCVFKLEVTR